MEPSNKVNQIVLRQWDMPKESGKKSSCYVLIKSWNEAVEKNDLGRKLIQVIQIWSFRVGNDDQLCLALVVVKTRENNEVASSSGQGRERVHSIAELEMQKIEIWNQHGTNFGLII
nr:hypothetical protein CFP56_72469 [Quercus suber]